MQVPVYEYTDGEAINGFIKTTTGDIEYTQAGIVGQRIKTTLRKVESRYGYTKKALPVNYKKITKAQAVEALRAAKYGYMMVSVTGDNTLAYHGLAADTRYN